MCYEREREDVRSRLIAWLKSQQGTQAVEGYNNLLRRYFEKLDKNNDTKLDAMEFLELIEANSTVEEVRGSKIVVDTVLIAKWSSKQIFSLDFCQWITAVYWIECWNWRQMYRNYYASNCNKDETTDEENDGNIMIMAI